MKLGAPRNVCVRNLLGLTRLERLEDSDDGMAGKPVGLIPSPTVPPAQSAGPRPKPEENESKQPPIDAASVLRSLGRAGSTVVSGEERVLDCAPAYARVEAVGPS